jgi:hypothetical protein
MKAQPSQTQEIHIMTQLLITLVRASDGSIDQDASLDACSDAIVKYCAERETEEATIADAVNALFDEHKGARLNMPFVQSATLRTLNVQPANYKVLSEKVAQYVRDHSQGEKAEDGSVARPDSLFLIGKGKGGGVARRCDLPPPAAPESK